MNLCSFLLTFQQFAYVAKCPASSCGSQEIPARGVCSLGRCICINPWTDDDCSVVGIPPQIVPIPNQIVEEGSMFDLQAAISEVIGHLIH